LGGDLELGHQSCLAHAGPPLMKLQSRSRLVARPGVLANSQRADPPL